MNTKRTSDALEDARRAARTAMEGLDDRAIKLVHHYLDSAMDSGGPRLRTYGKQTRISDFSRSEKAEQINIIIGILIEAARDHLLVKLATGEDISDVGGY